MGAEEVLFAKTTYEQRVAEEQHLNTRPIYDVLMKAKDVEGALSFGPTFHMATSVKNGSDMYTFRTIWIDNTKDGVVLRGHKSFSTQKTLIILAEDSREEIVAGRETEFWCNGRDYDAMGDVFTGSRAKGIATPLELVHLLILETMAKEEQDRGTYGRVVYKVEAGNPKMFTIVNKALLGKTDPEANSLREGKAEELRRWYHLYGSKNEGGILGFENGQRVFDGNGEYLVNMAGRQEVALVRSSYWDDVLDRQVACAEEERGGAIPITDASAFQKAQRVLLTGQILPKMASQIGPRNIVLDS